MNMDSISHAPTPIYSHGRHSTAYAIQKHKIRLSCYDSLRVAYRFKINLRLIPKSCVVTGYEEEVSSGLFICRS